MFHESIDLEFEIAVVLNSCILIMLVGRNCYFKNKKSFEDVIETPPKDDKLSLVCFYLRGETIRRFIRNKRYKFTLVLGFSVRLSLSNFRNICIIASFFCTKYTTEKYYETIGK